MLHRGGPQAGLLPKRAEGQVCDRAHPNLRAALFVTPAMACFCVNDAFIKALTARVPIGELMAVRGVFVVA